MSKAILYQESQMSKRVPLAEQVPLEKPFTIRISPSSICNFQCEFCMQFIPELRREFGKAGNNGLMEFDFFVKLIDDIKKSFGQVKKISLVGRGEPLLHPRLADMVSYITEQKVAAQVEILTNAATLTPDVSDRLIAAGLSTLRISVNGLSAEDYWRHCHIKLDFDRYLDQIKYFYTNRGKTSVYVKIINYMVNTQEKQEKFFQIFSPICDVINIENLHQTNAGIDYQGLTTQPEKLDYSQKAMQKVQSEICSSPFYVLQVDESGFVLPCGYASAQLEGFYLGNLNDESIGTIWTQKSYPFQCRMLDGTKGIPFCQECSVRYALTYPEDVLDQSAEYLKKVYDGKLSACQKF